MSAFAAYGRLGAEIARARREAMVASIDEATLLWQWGRDLGHIYAIRFTTGIVKVGRTQMVRQRFNQHKRYALKNGFGIDRVWWSKRHPGYTKTETRFKAFCADLGSPVPGKSEYFTGFAPEEFGAVCAYGILIASDAVRHDYVDRLTTAVDGDETKTAGEAHAAAAAKDPSFAWLYGSEFPARAA